MDTFKFIVDILSSIASIIAILTVWYAWRVSIFPPLVVSKLILAPRENKFRILIRIQNKKSYSIKINHLTCYKNQSYQVQRQKFEKPQLWPSINLSDKIFSTDEVDEIPELGVLNKEIIIDENNFDPKTIKLFAYTSHGQIELKCKGIGVITKEFEVLDPGDVAVNQNMFSARLIFVRMYMLYLYESFLKMLRIVKGR